MSTESILSENGFHHLGYTLIRVQNDVFQSYGNDRIKGVNTEHLKIFCKVKMIGYGNKAIKTGHL